jgi:hypothetical protein
MLDNWIASLESGKCISENDLKQLCYMVKMILIEEANVQPVSAPVLICGDIHGQFYDLLELFRNGGPVPNSNYIFMVSFIFFIYHNL